MSCTRIMLMNDDRHGDLCGSMHTILSGHAASPLDVVEARLTDLSLADSCRLVLARCTEGSPDLVILMEGRPRRQDFPTFFRGLARQTRPLPLLAVVDDAEPDEMVTCLRDGALDFITPPLREGDLLPRIWRWQARRPTPAEPEIRRKLKERLGLQNIIGESEAFMKVVEQIVPVADCDAGVLITGETGTGKELIARTLHYLSPRSGRPFVPVNCGAIPVDLAENEFFGHEKGAYTGAGNAKPGLVAEAEGGTLFLDEVDALPQLMQTKLLRLLQEKEYRRLGSSKTRTADIRVVAAANADLTDALKQRRLREDLYFRLNVVPLRIPPLRERPEDISLLADHFLEKYAAAFDRPGRVLSAAAREKLHARTWPGNVRELEHVVQRAVVLSQESIIGPHLIEPTHEERSLGSFGEAKAEFVARFEKDYLERVLRQHSGNISRAARTAGKHRRAFWELMRKHEIDADRFRE